MKYGPERGELWFRLVFSIAGLGLLGVALARHGVSGLAWFEIVLIAGGFFGGTAVWTIWQLARAPGNQHSDDEHGK